jgi:hypothetical protein
VEEMEGMEVEGTEVGAETLVCLDILGLQDRGEEIMGLMAETMENLVYLVDLVYLVHGRNKIM